MSGSAEVVTLRTSDTKYVSALDYCVALLKLLKCNFIVTAKITFDAWQYILNRIMFHVLPFTCVTGIDVCLGRSSLCEANPPWMYFTNCNHAARVCTSSFKHWRQVHLWNQSQWGFQLRVFDVYWMHVNFFLLDLCKTDCLHLGNEYIPGLSLLTMISTCFANKIVNIHWKAYDPNHDNVVTMVFAAVHFDDKWDPVLDEDNELQRISHKDFFVCCDKYMSVSGQMKYLLTSEDINAK